MSAAAAPTPQNLLKLKSIPVSRTTRATELLLVSVRFLLYLAHCANQRASPFAFRIFKT